MISTSKSGLPKKKTSKSERKQNNQKKTKI